MAKGTPATLALEKAGITFKLHEYDYDPNAPKVGMQAAEALGIEPARLLKTLMAKAGDDVVCVLLASDREVNLKKLAAAAGEGPALLVIGEVVAHSAPWREALEFLNAQVAA